jgi:hypothetical protein
MGQRKNPADPPELALDIRKAVVLLEEASGMVYPGLGTHARIAEALELLTGKKYRIKNVLLNGQLEEVK